MKTAPHIPVLIAAAAAAIGLVGQFGAISRWADSVNYLTPLWFVAGAVAGVIATLLSKAWGRRIGLASLAVLLATGGASLWRERGEPLAPGVRPDLKIVQFNVSKNNLEPGRAAEWILAQQADVIVLEEAAVQGAAITGRLRVAYPYATDCLGSIGRCSTVILSRTAPLRSDGHARGDPENRKTLSAVSATFSGAWGTYTVFGVHMRRPWPYDDQTPDIDRLASLLRQEDQAALIVAGDFNQPPWTFAMQRQDRAIALPRLTGREATWPSGRLDPGIGGLTFPMAPILPIDHVYAGLDWKAASIERGPSLGSEHRPLVIELVRRSRPSV